ncbi:MoaD/ThiS family protein [Desulfothermus okinawensis JCM 13304]
MKIIMRIEVLCFATLKKYTPDNEEIEIEKGFKVYHVLEKLGIDKKEVKVIFINGKHASLDSELKEGDRLALFPAVGGG